MAALVVECLEFGAAQWTKLVTTCRDCNAAIDSLKAAPVGTIEYCDVCVRGLRLRELQPADAGTFTPCDEVPQ